LTILTDSANLSFNYSYDTTNRVTSRTSPNGVTSSYGYDGLNRMTSLTHAKAATTLINNQYTYNDANTISSWTNASGNHAYTYDADDRLTSATNSSQNENYTYDAVGNRTASHLSANYNYQPFNKLASTVSATYSFDNNGNVISKTDSLGVWTFSYDGENRLTQVIIPTGPTVNYKYDGLGRRTQRTTSAGANERYVYDGLDALIDLNTDGSVAATYLNDLGIDNHLRQSSATTGVSYFLNDHLGSTVGLTDAIGNLAEMETYDSFGNGGSGARTRYTYTGRERDPDTGILYYRARFYDQQIGRFLSEDPLGLGPGPNPYEYGYDNPLRYIDPTGNQPWDWAVAGGGTLAGTGAAGGAIAAGGAVVVGYGVVLYGAWHLGEWVAEQPWNPLTHPKLPPMPPFPWAVPKCDSKPKVSPLPPPPSDNDICYKRWLVEDAQCLEWRRLGWRVVSACKERAATRRNLCVRNGGRPNPAEPPEYSPFRDYPR